MGCIHRVMDTNVSQNIYRAYLKGVELINVSFHFPLYEGNKSYVVLFHISGHEKTKTHF